MAATTIADIESYVANLMKQKFVNDYELVIDGSSEKGDGYLGEVNFVRVHVKSTASGATLKTYNIVVKSAKKSEELRRRTPIKEAYDREINVYTKILPLFERFQLENNGFRNGKVLFNKYPKCFSVCRYNGKEALLLQNQKSLQYQLHDRKCAMDVAHVELVLKNYAHWHAISIACKLQKRNLFRVVAADCSTNILARFMTDCDMLGTLGDNYLKAIEFLELENPKVYDKMKPLVQDIESILMKDFSMDSASTVLLHGDCWNNNFMFKYEDKSKPTHPTNMVFLDFQLMRLASPVYDLSYFLYCCAGREALDEFQRLLVMYHTVLAAHLRDDFHVTDMDSVLSFAELEQQWRLYGKFGLFMAPFLLKITMCDAEEAPDFTAAAESSDGFKTIFNIAIKDEECYRTRIRDLFTHYAEAQLS